MASAVIEPVISLIYNYQIGRSMNGADSNRNKLYKSCFQVFVNVLPSGLNTESTTEFRQKKNISKKCTAVS